MQATYVWYIVIVNKTLLAFSAFGPPVVEVYLRWRSTSMERIQYHERSLDIVCKVIAVNDTLAQGPSRALHVFTTDECETEKRGATVDCVNRLPVSAEPQVQVDTAKRASAKNVQLQVQESKVTVRCGSDGRETDEPRRGNFRSGQGRESFYQGLRARLCPHSPTTSPAPQGAKNKT